MEKIIRLIKKAIVWFKHLDYSSLTKHILIAAAAAFLIFVLCMIVYIITQIYHHAKFRKNAVLLKVTPQDTCDLLKLEQMLLYIHGMLLNTQWRVLTEGRPYLAYEVVGRHKTIDFYIWVPEDFTDAIEDQMYISYPDCIIQKVEDHMVPLKQVRRKMREYRNYKKSKGEHVNQLKIRGMKLKRGKNYTFPFADKLDILPAIVAAMSQLGWDEKLVAQFILLPLGNRWQNKGRETIKRFEKKGKHPGSKLSSGATVDTDFREEFLDDLDAGAHRFSPTRDLTRADRMEIRESTKKVMTSGFETEVRILGIGFYGKGVKTKIRGIAAAFNKLDHINRWKKKRILIMKSFFYTLVQMRYMYLVNRYNILTPSELAGFAFRLPSKDLKVPEIVRNKMKQLPPPMLPYERNRNLLGQIVYRGMDVRIGIKEEDSRRHIHMVGAIGTGKSKELEKIAEEAIREGKGLIVMDPHGKLVDDILARIPDDKLDMVLLYDFSDEEYPVPFNFMKVKKKFGDENLARIIDEMAEELLNVLKSSFSDSWGIRTEKIFRHTIRALMEAEMGSLWNSKKMLKEKEYRDIVVKDIKNIAVKDFWETEFTGKTDSSGTFRLNSEIRNAIDSPLTKIDRFLSSPMMLNMVAQDDCIDFDECINEKKIVLFKIPKGVLKADNTKFLGQLVFAKLIMAFMSRTVEEMKHETVLLLDELHNFIAGGPQYFETLMDELRKYGVCAVLAHQRVSQIESILSAIRDNVGSTVCFRVGEESSAYMKKAYEGFLEATDLENLENRHAYVRLMVDGQKSEPFLMKSLNMDDVDPEVAKERVAKVIELNRQRRKSKEEIEADIRARLKELDQPEAEGGSFRQEVDEDYLKAVSGGDVGVKPQKVANGLPEEWQ